jgi:hypothetical protein
MSFARDPNRLGAMCLLLDQLFVSLSNNFIFCHMASAGIATCQATLLSTFTGHLAPSQSGKAHALRMILDRYFAFYTNIYLEKKPFSEISEKTTNQVAEAASLTARCSGRTLIHRFPSI